MSQTPHRVFFAQVNAAGTTSTPAGTVTKRKGDDVSMYEVSFPNELEKAPAVALTGVSGKQPQIRVNLYNGSENRKDHVDVDAYELALSKTAGEVKWADTSFNLLAALSGGGGARPLKLGDGTGGLRVVAGVIDGIGDFNVLVDHGGFSLGASKEGEYRIAFEAGFVGTPVVLATIQLHEEKVRTVQVLSADQTGATIEIRNSDGELAGGIFHFIAIGQAVAGQETASCRLVTGVVSRDGRTALAGAGFDHKKRGTATYAIDLNGDYNFEKTPVVIACTEHMKEQHLRQAQVSEVKKGGFNLEVFGFTNKGNQGYNDCVFHFIAYTPS